MKVHIDKDSLVHLGITFACLVIGTLAGQLVGLIAGNHVLGARFGMVFGVGVAIGASMTREYDGKQFYGHWCWWDILFDGIGIILGLALTIYYGWFIWN